MPRPKGIKQILSERGLWRKNMVGECRLCRDGNTDPLRVDCCGRKIISLQPDFLAQRSALVEMIEIQVTSVYFSQNFTAN